MSKSTRCNSRRTGAMFELNFGLKSRDAVRIPHLVRYLLPTLCVWCHVGCVGSPQQCVLELERAAIESYTSKQEFKNVFETTSRGDRQCLRADIADEFASELSSYCNALSPGSVQSVALELLITATDGEVAYRLSHLSAQSESRLVKCLKSDTPLAFIGARSWTVGEWAALNLIQHDPVRFRSVLIDAGFYDAHGLLLPDFPTRITIAVVKMIDKSIAESGL